MRRALRRAAQVFVAAGALGLVSPALAQSSRPVGKGMPASRSHEAKGMTPAGEASPDEIQVELAWLANKATFHHTLSARVVSGSLEVRGYVPNPALKELALRLAQQNTTLPVIDHLQVNQSMLIPVGGGPVEEMTYKASELLAADLGTQAAGLEITAEENGVVTVKGTVQSPADKLTVSRRMRQVDGCCSVVNQVNVAGVVRTSHSVTQTSADSSQASEMPGKAGVQGTTANKPSAYSTGAVALNPSKPPVVAKADAVKAPAEAEKKPAPPVGWSEKPVVAKESAAESPKPAITVVSKVEQKAPWVAPSATTTKADGSQWPAAQEEKPVQAAYTASGTVVFDDDATTKPAPTGPTDTTTSALPTAAASKLKKQVETACGKHAKEVRVEVKADKLMHVVVKVADAKVQSALTDRILQLPDMALPNVRLEMQVMDAK